MRDCAAALLLHLSLQTLVAADVPTFTQKVSKEYIGTAGDSTNVEPNDVAVSSQGSLTITFGTELSSKIHDTLKSKCKNPEDKECRKQLQQVMGIGPRANGVQKRVIGGFLAAGGVAISYLTYVILSYIWNDMDESHFKKVQITIPQDQVDEVSKWELDNGTFNYKPPNSDAVKVEMDSNQMLPDNAPSATIAGNGNIILDVPGLEGAIEDSWKSVKCTRQVERSIEQSIAKRVNVQCLVQFAQAILRVAQVGGPAENIQFVSPMDFPKPKNKLLVEAMKQDKDFAEDMFFSKSLDTEQRGSIADFASWMAFGYTVGHLELNNDKMVFSSSFLESQEEEDEKKKCPKKPYIRFCRNCGGNTSEKKGAYMGICEAIEKMITIKAAPCYVDRGLDTGPTRQDREAAFKHFQSPPEDAKEDKKTCYKQDTDRMEDERNWKFVQQKKLQEAVDKFCGDDWEDNDNQEKDYHKDDWDHVKITLSGKDGEKATKGDCKKALRHLNADCDWDGSNEYNTNQFNWKWGGEYVQGNGIKWIIAPQKERVIFDKPKNEGGRSCHRKGDFHRYRNQKNGERINTREAKMTFQQCVHAMREFDSETDMMCGDLLHMGLHNKRGYKSTKDCSANTWPCLSYYVHEGYGAEGKHRPTTLGGPTAGQI
ncbi:hypothetical protein AJ79_03264 [Helicocarpus griseus UAMH5409]|uniref:Ecp2 effector protein domain-containing protein n=1 Tax=Helicocarpus griseus UAMH5409 TaxID=1447875 RepID=A0A2B7XYH4_9EURO|nr:hypothetical protein AJ79_03264 [Helicocarpus griseus UAMH5409]